jgi:hypothetical protein
MTENAYRKFSPSVGGEVEEHVKRSSPKVE